MALDRRRMDDQLARKLAELHLVTVEISPNNHCLFSALKDQLERKGCTEKHSHTTLRRGAAAYMRQHAKDFEAFLDLGSDPSSRSNTFEQYCNAIEKTSRWGGEHEIMALSHYLKCNIHVLHQEDLSTKMYPSTRSPYGGAALFITYHTHGYGGAHYNSVMTLGQQKEERLRRLRTRERGAGGQGGVGGGRAERAEQAERQPERAARAARASRAAGAGGEVGVDLPHLDAERWSRVRKALEASALRCVPPRAPAGQREARALCLRAAPRSRLSSRVGNADSDARVPRQCAGNVHGQGGDIGGFDDVHATVPAPGCASSLRPLVPSACWLVKC